MKRKTFIFFMTPTLVAMALLIALPLVGVGYLSTVNSYIQTEFKEVTESNPLTGSETKTISQPVLDNDGNTIRIWENVGSKNYQSIVGADLIDESYEDRQSEIQDGEDVSSIFSWMYELISDIAFLSALEFTLLYVIVTTPLIIITGFVLALSINKMTRFFKTIFIPATLLPFIITPVIGALAIKWLFMDNSLVTVFLENMGFGKIYFLESKWTTRFLILLYGVWHSAPFAFVVLYAGLQTLPEDTMEASRIDGATKWQTTRHVVIPHLMPLFTFVSLIAVMDAYRVFEPILVFSGGNNAMSLQYLTYDILANENNYFKAAAASVLTVIGIVILLTPIIIKTYREYRRG